MFRFESAFLLYRKSLSILSAALLSSPAGRRSRRALLSGLRSFISDSIPPRRLLPKCSMLPEEGGPESGHKMKGSRQDRKVFDEKSKMRKHDQMA